MWWRLVDFVVELREGVMFPQIIADTRRLDSELRRLVLPAASVAVFGVNLAVPTARVPDVLLQQYIEQEDASRRPTFKKDETRQFLVAAQPFLAAPVRYSPAEIVAMIARGERPVIPKVPDTPAAGAEEAGADVVVASGATPAAGRRPRSPSTGIRRRPIRSKTASGDPRAAASASASASGAPPAAGAAVLIRPAADSQEPDQALADPF